jgi:hypothetical protein
MITSRKNPSMDDSDVFTIGARVVVRVVEECAGSTIISVTVGHSMGTKRFWGDVGTNECLAVSIFVASFSYLLFETSAASCQSRKEMKIPTADNDKKKCVKRHFFSEFRLVHHVWIGGDT